MIRAVKAVSTYRGRDPRDFALFAFGGNGPVVGAQIAGMMEMRHVIIPPGAGVFSAFGLLLSDLEHEMTQGYLRPLAEMTVADLASRFANLECAVALLLGEEALGAAQFTRLADLRYTGQAHELTITVPEEPLDMARLATAFGDEHERNYGHRADADAVECVTLRVVGRLPVSRASQIASRIPGTAAGSDATSVRAAYFGPAHGMVNTRVLGRADLSSEALRGPLIIEEYDTTVVVPPGWSASRDASDNIHLFAEVADDHR
jgi:N-methylhydantoinase A